MRELTITEQEAVNGGWNFWTWIGKVASATAVIASYEGYDGCPRNGSNGHTLLTPNCIEYASRGTF